MTSREIMRAAMRREPTDRIPCMPQICHDVAVRLYAEADGGDWIDGMGRCVEDPSLVWDYVIRLVREVGCDGLRLFLKPAPRRVRREGDELVVVDEHTGRRTGKIDVHGGGGYVPDAPTAPVQSLEEARDRLEAMAADVDDAKVAMLRTARDRVPDLFVASSPAGFTMNTYNILRGREQAMYDFFERPDFVLAVMEMQVQVGIRRAERLLEAGIDALYIGDPSASASLISPEHFRRFCFPGFRTFCDHFRDRNVLIYIHICGNSDPLLEMMAETGTSCVEPLDPLGGVSVAEAKRRIGSRVALMGGVNTITLANGTPEQVRREAISKCREGGPHGYILAAGDMVPPNTSWDNLRALVDVSRESLWR